MAGRQKDKPLPVVLLPQMSSGRKHFPSASMIDASGKGFTMSDAVAIISGQIAAMFLLMAAGSALYRVKLLNDTGVSQTSGLVLYVVNPIFIAEAPMRLFGAALLMDAPLGRAWHGSLVRGWMLLFGCVHGRVGQRRCLCPHQRNQMTGAEPLRLRAPVQASR